MTPQPKAKGGRPTFEPKDEHRRIVTLATAFNIPQEKIALALGISDRTLRKHFKKEISTGHAQMEIQLASNLMKMSNKKEMDGVALKATLSLLQMRFGWSQYAPPPVSVEPVKGKKQLLDEAAQPGNEPQEWADLLN